MAIFEVGWVARRTHGVLSYHPEMEDGVSPVNAYGASLTRFLFVFRLIGRFAEWEIRLAPNGASNLGISKG